MNNTQKYLNQRNGQKKRFFQTPQTDQERFGTNDRKAIIYVRVSDISQVKNGNGLESQESICREWCTKQKDCNINVVKVFREEGVSGSLMDRKAMNNAIKFLEQENKKYSKIHYFVVTDIDRISRPEDIAEAITLEKTIESLGVKIVTVNNKRDTDTDEGKFMHAIQYAVAGLERRKILRRTMNGKLNSLKNGGRPFPCPPLGYTREKVSEKDYIDTIDRTKGNIIKEGLELYAYNQNFTKTQLHKFWEEKGLTTNSNKKKLHFTFIEKTFREYRLHFYAGYVYYPEWGIEQPIKGKHEGIIDIEVAKKIIERENNNDKKRSKSPNIDENLDIHPLKGLITCPGCKRRLGCYKSKGNGGYYYYYACANKYCNERSNIAKAIIENEFGIFVEKMKLAEGLFNLFEAIAKRKREERKQEKIRNLPKDLGALSSIKDRMEKIEEKILTVNNINLVEKLENEWGQLESLYSATKNSIDKEKENKDSILETLNAMKFIFTNPVSMRENSNYDIRQLLIMVRFNGVLYYKKNQGYRTDDTKGLYYLFSRKGDTHSHKLPGMGLEPTHIAVFDFESNMSTIPSPWRKDL